MNETTKTELQGNASTVQVPHAFDVPGAALGSGGIIGIVATMILGFLGLRRRWSKDNLELTKDRAETNLIASYQKTIADLQETNKRLDENAREAWRTRAEDAKRIGELTAKVENQNAHIERQNATIERLEIRITELTEMVARSVRSNNPTT